MKCLEFERWLDDGMPQPPEKAVREHAVRCARCADSLRAALEIEGILGRPAPAAPSSLADRVVERISEEGRRQAPIALLYPVPAMPWWLEAVADPAAALAFVLAALLAYRIEWFSGIGHALLTGVDQATVLVAAEWMRWLASLELDATAVQWGLWFVLLPALAWGSFLLYRWTERIAVRGIRSQGAASAAFPHGHN